jgi:hypothetical protein
MHSRSRFHRPLATALAGALLSLSLGPAAALASAGSIDATNHYAWDDNGGYVNWNANNGNVTITDSALTGHIWSAGFGWINLSPSQGGVTNSSGTLAGYAWGANTGWINFTGVTIDSNGQFHGTTVAQSLFGTMTFDCTYCNVTTSWRNSSVAPTSGTSGGGGGTIRGSQSYGYQTQIPSTDASAASTTPSSLVPTAPPPTNTQPATSPASNTTTPAHLTPSITFTIYTTPTAAVGNPIALNITFSSGKRAQAISYAYRLYRADGSIAYSQTGTLAASGAPSLSVSIPTSGLAAGTYNVAVSAQYGKQSIASQTLPIALYATKAEASSHVSDVGSTTNSKPVIRSCSWLTCWWPALISFFRRFY